MSRIESKNWLLPITFAVAAALAAPASFATGNGDEEEEEPEFEEAQIYLELNDTDGDLGIHGLIDADAWKHLKILDPFENVLMSTWIRGRLRRQGMTEFFFESDEPTFDELPPAQFFSRFPEGTYEIMAITLDGEEFEDEAELSHVLAGPPGNIRVNGIPSAENCDADDLPAVSGRVKLDWDPVTMSHPTLGTTGVPVKVLHYEVVGEIEREGKTPEELIMSVILPRWKTQFAFPAEFTRLAGDEMKFEIVTKLDNGNQTAVESCFEVE